MYFGPTFPTRPLFAEKIRPAAGLRKRRIVIVCIHHKVLYYSPFLYDPDQKSGLGIIRHSFDGLDNGNHDDDFV